MNFLLENANIIFIVLSVLVLGLSIYLGILLSQVKKKNDKMREEKEKKDLFIKDSLKVIALATIQGQCDLSECCIRVKNLIDYFPKLASKAEFQVFQQMYEEIKSFPTHERRLEQSKQQIFQQDSLRFKIEDRYREDMIKSLDLLRTEVDALT